MFYWDEWKYKSKCEFVYQSKLNHRYLKYRDKSCPLGSHNVTLIAEYVYVDGMMKLKLLGLTGILFLSTLLFTIAAVKLNMTSMAIKFAIVELFILVAMTLIVTY